MTEFSYTVHDDNGIHARPAGLLVSQAQKHPCSIRMFCGERQADCKRLFHGAERQAGRDCAYLL